MHHWSNKVHGVFIPFCVWLKFALSFLILWKINNNERAMKKKPPNVEKTKVYITGAHCVSANKEHAISRLFCNWINGYANQWSDHKFHTLPANFFLKMTWKVKRWLQTAVRIYSIHLNKQNSNVVVFSLVRESSNRYWSVATQVMIATGDVTEEPDRQNWGKDWHGHNKCLFLDVNIKMKRIPRMMTTPLIQIILL